MDPCVFCGEVPTQLPHWCILERRRREEEAFLSWAASQEQAERDRDEMHRALIRVGSLEQQYTEALSRMGGLIDRAERLERKH